MSASIRAAAAATAMSILTAATGLGASPSPVVTTTSSAPGSSPATTTVRFTVAGSDVDGPLRFATAELPEGWEAKPWGGRLDVSDADWTVFLVTYVDNTFSDPCSRTQRSPKVASAADAVDGLGDIGGTDASATSETTIAGHTATYLTVTIPDVVPCELDAFHLWQDSPNNDWWALGTGEVIGLRVLDLDGRPVVVATRTLPGTTEETTARLEAVLDTLAFEPLAAQASPSPGPS